MGQRRIQDIYFKMATKQAVKTELLHTGVSLWILLQLVVKDASKSRDEIKIASTESTAKLPAVGSETAKDAAPAKAFRQTRAELTPQQGNGRASVHG